MNLTTEDRTLAARALRVFAAQQRRSAPQPTSQVAQTLYRTIMQRAVQASTLADRLEQ